MVKPLELRSEFCSYSSLEKYTDARSMMHHFYVEIINVQDNLPPASWSRLDPELRCFALEASEKLRRIHDFWGVQVPMWNQTNHMPILMYRHVIEEWMSQLIDTSIAVLREDWTTSIAQLGCFHFFL